MLNQTARKTPAYNLALAVEGGGVLLTPIEGGVVLLLPVEEDGVLLPPVQRGGQA